MDGCPAIEPAGDIVAQPVATRRRSLLSRHVESLRFLFGGRAPYLRNDLLEALAEITSVMSSRMSIEGVLQTVADETKTVVGCSKALVCLTGEQGEIETTVVRGMRDEFPEAWWLPEVRAVSRELEPGRVVKREYRRVDARIVCVPICVREVVVGVLVAINPVRKRFDTEQLTLLAILGSFAAAALENARLVASAQYSLLASERNRIAKEMHDGLAQSLFSASLALEVCKKNLVKDPAVVAEQLAETQQVLSGSVSELRRYIYDLRPASLDRLGLVGAIESAVDEAAKSGRAKARLRLEGKERHVDPAAEACLYRIAQEGIANACKHAKAKTVHVSLSYSEYGVELEVVDDGHGFDVGSAVKRSERGTSIGLRSIHDRVRAQGGRVRIESKTGEGTRLWVRIPC